MNEKSQESQSPINAEAERPDYATPVVRVMSESEVLSAFQVTAAGTHSWWAM